MPSMVSGIPARAPLDVAELQRKTRDALERLHAEEIRNTHKVILETIHVARDNARYSCSVRMRFDEYQAATLLQEFLPPGLKAEFLSRANTACFNYSTFVISWVPAPAHPNK